MSVNNTLIILNNQLVGQFTIIREILKKINTISGQIYELQQSTGLNTTSGVIQDTDGSIEFTLDTKFDQQIILPTITAGNYLRTDNSLGYVNTSGGTISNLIYDLSNNFSVNTLSSIIVPYYGTWLIQYSILIGTINVETSTTLNYLIFGFNPTTGGSGTNINSYSILSNIEVNDNSINFEFPRNLINGSFVYLGDSTQIDLIYYISNTTNTPLGCQYEITYTRIG